MVIIALRWVNNPNGTRDLQYHDDYQWRYIEEVTLSQAIEEERQEIDNNKDNPHGK